jgi:dTDP-4-amino-4,6-dideoxygalactose transaminase
VILMNDFRREPAALGEAMRAAAARVLDSGHYILGPEVVALEREWAARCGVPHAVGVANGMDAIEIALRALGIGPGDEVITTAITAFASVLAIVRAGAGPVLADIDPGTGLLDPASVRRCLGPRVRALLVVHLYGQLRDVSGWVRLCEDAGIALVEDCAQAHAASEGGRGAGSFGVAGAFSFYPTKNLGAVGDAGMLVTGDAALGAQAACLRNYGQSDRYHHPVLGLNSRLDELQAGLLRARLAWLDEFTARRRAIASAYRSGIRHRGVSLLQPPVEPLAHVHHLFVVLSQARDALQRHLADAGIQTLCHYPVPVHRQPSAAAFRCDPAGLAAAERHAATCLSLPCHPGLTDADVGRVIDAVNGFGA